MAQLLEDKSLFENETAKQSIKQIAAIAAVAGLCTFAPQASAELVPSDMPIDDETGVYKLTLTDEEHKSANSIVLYEVDKTANPWTATPQYYDLTLNQTTYTFGTGENSRTFQVKAPYENVTITAKWGESVPSRYKNPSSVTSGLVFANLSHAIFNDVSSTDTGNLDNLAFINNSADGDGGAIYNHGEATIGNITNSTFIGNRARSYYDSFGGAIDNSATIGDITDSTFIGNNAADDGGAIANRHYATIGNITGSIFIGNGANGGGVIFNYQATIGDITDSTFIGNGANIYGGAICNYYNATIDDITDSTFIGNRTNSGGGAIYNSGTIGDIVAAFIGNKANPNGGGGGTYNAGAVWNSGVINSLKGDFIENTVGRGNGGAVYNTGTIKEIDATFIGNKSLTNDTSSMYNGGAIYNTGNIESLKGDFIGNTVDYGCGGAIYNGDSATIGDITGTFSGNSATNGSGGAIYNYSTIGDITNSTFSGNNATNGSGGAIFNNYATIGDITGSTFIRNSATGRYCQGGAIYNYKSTIGDITDSTFNGNSAGINGGAIYNYYYVTIGDITGSIFSGNSAGNNGGAIYNGGSNVTLVDSDFVNNSAGLYGGAIYNINDDYNNANVNVISENKDVLFSGNTANGTSNDIYNGSVGNVIYGVEDSMSIGYSDTIKVSEGLNALNDMFSAYDNGDLDTAKTKYDEASNAFRYVSGRTSSNNIYSKLSNVLADMGETDAQNAANELSSKSTEYMYSASQFLYSYGMVWKDAETFINDETSMNNSRTYLAEHEGDFNTKYQLYLEALDNANEAIAAITQPLPETEAVYEYLATLNLNAAENRSIVLNGGIDGSDGSFILGDSDVYGKGIININKEIENLPNGGTVVFNETVKNNDLNVYAGTLHLGNRDNVIDGLDVTMYGGLLNTINNQTGTVALNTLTLQNDFNMAVDVDLANEKMDRLTADTYNLNDHKVNVVGMNLISDATKNDTTILFADNELKNSVNNMVDEAGLGVDTLYQTTAYSPLYKYTVKYQVKDNGGYYNFSGGPSGGDFNPAVLASSTVAQANIASVQNVVNNYAFSAVDNSALNPRLGSRFDNRYALGNDQLIKDDLNTNNPLFVKPDQESVWVKPFVTFENIPLKNGPKVNSITYGTLIGYDSNPKYYKRGFEGVWSGYIGYTGANIHTSGVDSTSNGGLLGTTFSLYKGNFFNATTLTAGAMLDQASTMYGKDNITTLYAGVGNKVGYNLRFKEGLFTLQPSLLLSYTFGNTFDYTNAAGVRINSDPIHSIQISPGLKFYMNTKSGWQPYLGVNMMWNIMDQTHVRANGVKLPEMSIKPYVQYGIGIQKTVKDNFTAYGQAMIQNGGRNGISLTMGFKWAIGKNKNKIQKVHTNQNKTVLKAKNNQSQSEKKILKASQN